MRCKIKSKDGEKDGEVKVLATKSLLSLNMEGVKADTPISRRSRLRVTGDKTVEIRLPDEKGGKEVRGETGEGYFTLTFSNQHDATLFSHDFLQARFYSFKAKPKTHIYECSLSEIKKKRTIALAHDNIVIMEDKKTLISVPSSDVDIEDVEGSRLVMNGVTIKFSSAAIAHMWRCINTKKEYVSKEYVGYGDQTCELCLAGCYAALLEVRDDDDNDDDGRDENEKERDRLIAITPIPHTTSVEVTGNKVMIQGLDHPLVFSDVIAARNFVTLLGVQPPPKASDIVIDVLSEKGNHMCAVHFEPTLYTSVFCSEVVYRVAEACGLDHHDIDLDEGGHRFKATPLLCPAVTMPNGGKVTLVPPNDKENESATLRLSMEILKATYQYTEMMKKKNEGVK